MTVVPTLMIAVATLPLLQLAARLQQGVIVLRAPLARPEDREREAVEADPLYDEELWRGP